jgi:hypothetical protein
LRQRCHSDRSRAASQKKLGDLSGADNGQNNVDRNQNNVDVDFYLQHFDKPVEKSTMEAIKVLIEERNKMQKKGSSQKSAAGASGLLA